MYTDLALYIGGTWRSGDGRKDEDVLNPATGKALARLPHASTDDLDEALDAAVSGLAVWRATSAYDRAKVLRKAAGLVRERADRHRADHDAGAGQGPARIARRSAGHRRHHRMVRRGGPPRLWPHRAGPRKGTRQLVMQEPIGVVAAFTPWNFPTLTPARKIGASLAAGCSIIIKASEETPGSCVELVKCFIDAGLPAGVLNLVFGVPANDLGAPDRVRRGAQDFVHRLDPGRQASRGACGEGHEARDHGARRPFAGRGVR